ncbi:MAG: bifunctional DNA-formamidopyrimidine glycosylase/DNA-(apurinic or apyrimidinic site) lyase [Pseudomonadota bacterium]|nr:MAG: bifunctional DNA-formamidopyrimidine glycosylase/DNA-(apurinic or apyrimidinic site) lyase [Pseudomonadota bacterium]
MPELPEVETTLRGIAPHIVGRTVRKVVVRERRLRWPISRTLQSAVRGQPISAASRRAKYLLLTTPAGTIVIHLGMSGSLRIVPADTPPQAHDHLDIVFDNGRCLRLRDPRRFGAVLWTVRDPMTHARLRDLGPEPLSDALSGDYLLARSRGRRLAVKQFIMDSHVVVGVGNIYASEALYLARIHPKCAAGRITRQRYTQLADAIKAVLGKAIGFGGTTLRDFTNSDGRPGYFRNQLCVYDRAGEPCEQCGTQIRKIQQGQRATYYCSKCQH